MYIYICVCVNDDGGSLEMHLRSSFRIQGKISRYTHTLTGSTQQPFGGDALSHIIYTFALIYTLDLSSLAAAAAATTGVSDSIGIVERLFRNFRDVARGDEGEEQAEGEGQQRVQTRSTCSAMGARTQIDMSHTDRHKTRKRQGSTTIASRQSYWWYTHIVEHAHTLLCFRL